MRGCRRYKKAMSLYVDGILPERKAASLLAHIRKCPACAAEMESLKNLVAELNSLPAPELSLDFHDSVMAMITDITLNNSRRHSPFRMAVRFSGALAAVMLMLIVFSAGISGVNTLFSLNGSKSPETESGGTANINLTAETQDMAVQGFSLATESFAEPVAGSATAYTSSQAQEARVDIQKDFASAQSVILVGDTLAAPDFSGLSQSHYITIETDDLESSLSRIKSMGGFSRDAFYDQTSANITYIVPQGDYSNFMTDLASLGNITSERLNAYSVSDSRADAYYRMTSKQSEYERLLELLKISDTVPNMLLIETRLESVANEADYYASQYSALSNSAENTAVYITIIENKPDGTASETLTQRLSDSFKHSVEMVSYASQMIIVLAAAALVPTAMITAVAAAAWFIYKRIRGRKWRM